MKLADPQVEPLRLVVTEEEVESVNELDCVPLVLSLAEAVRTAESHALCVALPHCETDGVKLEECVALPHWERDGVKLGECVALSHCEREGV